MAIVVNEYLQMGTIVLEFKCYSAFKVENNGRKSKIIV